MLITPGDEDCRSAGSFFKNPVLSPDALRRAEAHGRRPRDWRFRVILRSTPRGKFQRHGWWSTRDFSKGYGNGRVGISRKHALAIVNRGNATAADIVALKNEIQRAVQERWEVPLETEPVFVGF